jgi:S-DNA-T family DNA segregation ATPase FtsK/SpoIIIE
MAEGLELEVRHGAPVSEVVAFARAAGVELPERPWCGPVRLMPDHAAGLAPLVAFARLTRTPGPDARPRPGAHLAVVGGPDAGAIATVSEGLSIGRGAQATLRLTDVAVSADHARLAGSRVHDGGSRNGTRVGGARVRGRATIAPGKLLELGATAIVLRDPLAGEVAAEARLPALRGAATWLTGGASMAVFAVATGHWPLALVALAVPGVAVGVSLLRGRRRAPDPPLLDVTGTLGLDPLPSGPACVIGPRGLMRAVTLATGRPPRDSPQWEEWMVHLPASQREVRWIADGEEPPSWAEVVFAERAGRLVMTAHGATVAAPMPLVSAELADAAARRIASSAADAAIPATVTWAELPAPAPGGLRVRLGVGENGPVSLDLVADGPHILIAGTTGSGKSEALRTIIGSLAHDHSPAAVTFALIDFKGGAGLGPCTGLPHVTSVLTDLEPHLARRCLLALAAELEDRKRAAASAGVRSYDEWASPPPRLVVVIDEFQEMAAIDRDFMPHLTRLAAQGRSLGIHLVLATQRPAGAVSADVRANISTTLALRTATEAESRDLVGSPAASMIPTSLPGRAVLSRGAGPAAFVQIALPSAEPPPAVRLAAAGPSHGLQLVDAAVRRHSGPTSAARAPALWLPPLPERLAPAPGEGFALGVADLPERRAREAARWDPAAGPLIVSGPPRSGRTAALLAVAARAAEGGFTPMWVPPDPRRAARTLALAADQPRALVLLDDAERTLAAASTAEPEAIDLLLACLRRGAAALVVPPAWANHRLVAGAGLVAILTGLPVEDDAAWGVPSELRGIPRAAGRARVRRADGWAETQLSVPAPFTPTAPVEELPESVAGPLPQAALGIGGDQARPIVLPQAQAAVIGPPGDERDIVARRVAMASGHEPLIADTGFALGMPGQPTPRTVVCVKPTARTLREVSRDRAIGLIEPAPVRLRCVAIVDGAALAVQVLPG